MVHIEQTSAGSIRLHRDRARKALLRRVVTRMTLHGDCNLVVQSFEGERQASCLQFIFQAVDASDAVADGFFHSLIRDSVATEGDDEGGEHRCRPRSVDENASCLRDLSMERRVVPSPFEGFGRVAWVADQAERHLESRVVDLLPEFGWCQFNAFDSELLAVFAKLLDGPLWPKGIEAPVRDREFHVVLLCCLISGRMLVQ